LLSIMPIRLSTSKLLQRIPDAGNDLSAPMSVEEFNASG
jgi:hypothetical protein